MAGWRRKENHLDKKRDDGRSENIAKRRERREQRHERRYHESNG